MFEKKTRDNPKYMYLVRRVEVRVEHKECHISEGQLYAAGAKNSKKKKER